MFSGTASGTTTTVDAGDGNNAITVSNSSQALDQVLGPLTINGGTGQDPLAIDDSGNGQPQTYDLTATSSSARDSGHPDQLQRDLQPGLPCQRQYGHQRNRGRGHAGRGPGEHPARSGNGRPRSPLDSTDIQGPVTFHWSQGVKSFVSGDHECGRSGTYQVLPDEITRTGAATIQFDDSGDPLAAIYLAAGGQNPAEIDVPKTIAATPVTIFSGAPPTRCW